MHLPTFGRYTQDMETLSNVQGYLGQFQLMKGRVPWLVTSQGGFLLHSDEHLRPTRPCTRCSLERFDNCKDDNPNQ